MQVAEVWINDRKVAANYCGYLPFVVDLTSLDRFRIAPKYPGRPAGQSRQSAVPPGKPQGELDFTYFGGLYRNVRLEVMDRLHIADPILSDKVGGGVSW